MHFRFFFQISDAEVCLVSGRILETSSSPSIKPDPNHSRSFPFIRLGFYNFHSMWRRAGSSWLRRFSTVVRRPPVDEGDWLYSSEWWGTANDDGHTVLRSTSGKGNGVVSVVAHPSSKPASSTLSQPHFPNLLGRVWMKHFKNFQSI